MDPIVVIGGLSIVVLIAAWFLRQHDAKRARPTRHDDGANAATAGAVGEIADGTTSRPRQALVAPHEHGPQRLRYKHVLIRQSQLLATGAHLQLALR